MQVTLFNEKIIKAKPFMKWAGGKRQLIPEIEKRLPKSIRQSGEINNYFEPFIGGGAVFFYLMSNYHVKNAYISDINKELILVYNVIKKDPYKLIGYLKELENQFLRLSTKKRKEFYLEIRSNFNTELKTHDFNKYNDNTIIRASNTIFMNKTGFNGLFRLNQKGEFNVPCGKYKNPKICDSDNIINVHDILENVIIKNESYLYSERYIKKESLVYLDPPYRPLSKTSYFTDYSSNKFNDKHQIELSKFFTRISDKGAYVLLSNSDPHNTNANDNFFDSLYSNYSIERIPAKRSINSNGDKRGSISELLINNYGD